MSEILLMVPQDNGDPELMPGGQVTAANGLIHYLEKVGHTLTVINVIPSNFSSASSFSKLKSLLKRLAVCEKLIRKKKVEFTIFFAGSKISIMERLLAAVYSELFGIPSAFFFRNSEILQISPKSFRGIGISASLKLVSRIFVQGEHWKLHLSEIGVSNNKIVVIPNWLPPAVPLSSQPKRVVNGESLKFIFVGRMIKEKGIFELVEAATILGSRYDFELTMVGDGPDKNELCNYCRSSNISNVAFLGWRDQSSVVSYLNRAHVFLFPSYHSEGFPNAVLEAMACGLPIIASGAGAISESVIDGRNGLILPSVSAQNISAAMVKYLSHSKMVSMHSQESLKVVRNRHDWEKNCENIAMFLGKT